MMWLRTFGRSLSSAGGGHTTEAGGSGAARAASVLRGWLRAVPVAPALIAVAALAIGGGLLWSRAREPPRAQKLYSQNCTECHGDKGGRVPAAPLNSAAFVRQIGDAGLAKVITEGKGIMPAWGKERGGPLDPEEVQILVGYLLSPQRIEGPGYEVYRKHCLDCHGEKGNRIPAVPLNSRQFLDGKSDEDLVQVLGQGKASMPAFAKGQGGPLSDAQLSSIVRYLRAFSGSTGPSKGAASPAGAGAPAASGEGKDLFAQNCTACHGAKGDQFPNANLSSRDFLQARGDALPKIIADGKGGMPAFGGKLSSAQIGAVADYLLAAAGGGGGGGGGQAAPAATQAGIPADKAVKPAPERAQELFKQNCAACHASKALPQVDPTTVHKIITEGIPSKGMPAWGDRLSSDDIEALAQLIASGKTTTGSAASANAFSGVVRHVEGWIIQHPAVVKESGAQLCYKCHQNSFCATCHTGGRVGQ